MLLCRSYDKIVHNLEWPHVGWVGDIRCWEFNMWLSCLQFHGWNLSYVRLLRYFMTRRNCNFLQWRGHDKKWKIKWPQKRLEKVERWHVCSSHVAADAISVYNSANSRRSSYLKRNIKKKSRSVEGKGSSVSRDTLQRTMNSARSRAN